MTYLGIGISPVGCFPTPRPPPNSVGRGHVWSAGAEGPQPELGETFFAGGLVGSVVGQVILGAGDADEVRELVDHQPDCEIPADALGVQALVLAHLAACVGDCQGMPLGLEAPGLMITSASRRRLPWGRLASDMDNISVRERGCS